MATHPNSGGGATALPLNLLAQAIPMLSRSDLEALTERLIDRLDWLDGDPDLEEDDPAGQCDEDGINTYGDLPLMGMRGHGPGCIIGEGLQPVGAI
mgnify:CR=1 FL=1